MTRSLLPSGNSSLIQNCFVEIVVPSKRLFDHILPIVIVSVPTFTGAPITFTLKTDKIPVNTNNLLFMKTLPLTYMAQYTQTTFVDFHLEILINIDKY